MTDSINHLPNILIFFYKKVGCLLISQGTIDSDVARAKVTQDSCFMDYLGDGFRLTTHRPLYGHEVFLAQPVLGDCDRIGDFDICNDFGFHESAIKWLRSYDVGYFHRQRADVIVAYLFRF